MKYIFIICSIFTIQSCQSQKTDSQPISTSPTINKSLASLYPLNGKWIELQTLEWIEFGSEQRNFKNSELYHPHLKSKIYSLFCTDTACIQFNEFNKLIMFPQNGMYSEKLEHNSAKFFFPISSGWITATSTPQDNLYTITAYNVDLSESWNTIYQKNSIDSKGQNIHFANVLGYNDKVLVFNSSSNDIRTSGLISLDNGQKILDNTQWVNVLLDTDQKTFLGSLIQDTSLNYILKTSQKDILLDPAYNAYQVNQVLVSGNNVFLCFYNNQGHHLKFICLDYNSGGTKWNYDLDIPQAIRLVNLSAFQTQFIIETETSGTSTLLVLNQQDGKVLKNF